nr:hypothetical protein [Acidithiobacillus caldus]
MPLVMPWRQQVIHGKTLGGKDVSNEKAMTAPREGLGAQEDRPAPTRQGLQGLQSFLERRRLRKRPYRQILPG